MLGARKKGSASIRGTRKRSKGITASRRSIVRYNNLLKPAFSPQKYCQLVYWDEFVLGQSSGVPVLYSFKLNSLYDPDQTSTGHQPYYYDQLSALYKKYRVFSTKLEFWYTSESNASLVLRATSEPSAPAATALGFQLENERPDAKSFCYSSGGPAVHKVIRYDARKILGASKSQYNDDDEYAGLTGGIGVGGDPNTKAFLNLMSYTTQNDSISVIRCKFTYTCKLYDRKPVVDS